MWRADETGIMEALQAAGITAGWGNCSVEIHRIPGDGSERKFFRVRRGSFHCVALISPRRRLEGLDENDSYFRIGNHLNAVGLPVPKILWGDPGRGRFLMEDAGDIHLQKLASRRGTTLLPLYRKVLKLLVEMHRRVRAGFDPGFCFDTDLYDAPFIYDRELEYFRKAFLANYLGLDVSAEDLRTDFERLAEAAGSRERSFVFHRDFQSRNLMVHGGGLKLIDFQGMRFGPPHYDLASLLVDPYVRLVPDLQVKLTHLYWTAARGFLGGSASQFLKKYSEVRLCRNLQILGAFGYLGLVGNKRHFLHYIPAAWRSLLHWLDNRCRGRYPQIEKWVTTAVRLRSGLLAAGACSQADRASSGWQREGKGQEAQDGPV